MFASTEARGRRLPHGGGENDEEAKQRRDASGGGPGHGFEVQESTMVEGSPRHSHGDTGLDFYVAVVGRRFRPCVMSACEVSEEAGAGSWASRSVMSDDLCGV
jgi:hypothetical protein